MIIEYECKSDLIMFITLNLDAEHKSDLITT